LAAKPRHGDLDLEKIEQLAAQGLTQEQIAACLGIGERTLYKRKNAEAEVAEAIRRGQAKGVALVTNKLFGLCKDGNLGAICFYMKTRGGWSEKHVMEHSGPEGGPLRIERVIVDANPDPDDPEA
jgi:transcriptional regulator with XRE-family HTH domain